MNDPATGSNQLATQILVILVPVLTLLIKEWFDFKKAKLLKENTDMLRAQVAKNTEISVQAAAHAIIATEAIQQTLPDREDCDLRQRAHQLAVSMAREAEEINGAGQPDSR